MPFYDITQRFLSTPSGWRATCKLAAFLNKMLEISIHALRVEGDVAQVIVVKAPRVISIHALRVEGDVHRFRILPCIRISIHALRVEGDAGCEGGD